MISNDEERPSATAGRTSVTHALLDELVDLCHHGADVRLGDLIARVDERSHALVAILFAAIFFLPVSIPGLSVFFGAIIMVVGVRMAEDLGPWMPARWKERRIARGVFTAVLKAASRLARFFHLLTRPRLALLYASRRGRRLNGSLIALCGFLLALPLPPGTNLPPAIAIVLIAFGIMERDGLFILIGYLVAVVNIIFFSMLAIAGFAGLKALYTLIGLNV